MTGKGIISGVWGIEHPVIKQQNANFRESETEKRGINEVLLKEGSKLELNKIYCMDCLEGLKMLPDKSIDLIITSPPYNQDLTTQGKSLLKGEKDDKR